MVHLDNILSEMVNKILVLPLELMDSQNVRREVILSILSQSYRHTLCARHLLTALPLS